MTDPARLAVRVQPGASRTHVGGHREGVLLVRVSARAVEGAANRAVVDAVATALRVRRRQVRVVRGERARDKLLEVTEPPADLSARVDSLRDGG